MAAGPLPIELRTSPHIKGGARTDVIMLNVVIALAPVVLFATFAFGLSALALVLACSVACVLTEYVFCRMSGRENTVTDFSALVTGILLALTLPPGMPLWMGVVGGFVAIGLGKALFGGLGFNPFNPALVGRAFLQAAFPVAITTWSPAFSEGRFTKFISSTFACPLMKPSVVDALSGATPLAAWKFEHQAASLTGLFMGTVEGSAGETSAIVILICGAYLAWRKMLDWRIPAAIFGSVFALSGLFFLINSEKYPNPLFMLFSGGLMLGAVFMATDMVTSPTTPLGVWIFGALIGGLTVIIRLKGGLPEGVMYAILIANGLSPMIESVTQPRVYGAIRKKKAKT